MEQTGLGVLSNANWKFDDGSGVIATDSISDNDGVLTGGPTWVAGRIDGALRFDGIDDYVSVPDSADLDFGVGDSFTFSMWVKYTTTNAWRVQKYASNRGYAFYSSSSSMTFHTWYSGVLKSAAYSGSLNDGAWHLITAVRDQNAGKNHLYIDGIKQAEVSTGSRNLANSGDLHLGTSSAAGGNFFEGDMDDVMIVGKALSGLEVWELYQAGSP